MSQRVAVWDKLLAVVKYDAIHHQDIIDILSHGATLGIPAESRLVRRRKVANSRTAIELAAVVDASVKRDVELRRMICLGRTLPSEWLYPFVSPVAVIPKPRSSKWRFINHLSHGGAHSVNHRIPREMARVQYLSLPEIARELLARGPGTFLFTFDIEEAFRHIPMRREDWPCLVFQWRGNYYVDTKLGFGSASGPKNWDRIGQGLSAIMLHHGVPLLRMVDDHMGFGETWDAARVSQLRAHCLLAHLGFPRAVHKDVGPAQEVDFDGLRWSTVTMTTSIPAAKWDHLMGELGALVAQSSTNLSDLRRTVGRLTHLLAVLPRGKAYLQECYGLVHAHSVPLRRPDGKPGREPMGAAERVRVHISPMARRELQWWRAHLGPCHAESPARPMEHLLENQPCAVLPGSPCLMVSVDASGVGLGAAWGWRWAFQPVSPYLDLGAAGGSGSTLVELGAILLACVVWGPEWRGHRVFIRTDNTGADSGWSRLHSPVPMQAEIIRAISDIAEACGFWLCTQWIPGELNVVADAISRSHMQWLRALAPGLDPLPAAIPYHALLSWMSGYVD